MSDKKLNRYVVQDENLLGYLLPELPHTVQILATSIIRGSIYSWVDGQAVSHPDRQRPATLSDFKLFRMSYREDPRFEPLAADTTV